MVTSTKRHVSSNYLVALSGIGLRDELVVCTIEVPSILSLSWEGEVNLAGTVSMCDLEYYQDSRDGMSLEALNNVPMNLSRKGGYCH